VSMFGGAALLLGAALFIWLWGPSRRQEADDDILDLDLALDDLAVSPSSVPRLAVDALD
jgi:hypothetical protein